LHNLFDFNTFAPATLYNIRMINSMTGFGAYRHPLVLRAKNHGQVHLELRSVNSRFLDITFRMPDELRFAEQAIREMIGKKLNRGKVEIKIYIQKEADSPGQESNVKSQEQKLNIQLIQSLKATESLILKELPKSNSLSVKDVLLWPGVMIQEELDQDALLEVVILALDEVLKLFMQSRAIEGNALKNVILNKVDQMDAMILEIEPLLPKIIQTYQQKLTEKLLAVLNGIDQQGRSFNHEDLADRIRQEVVLYGVRIDVEEEIARLKTHFNAVRNTLDKGGPVGKKLDFLMQELQRESNTLGSKSVHQETSNASMELKLLVEQIREQVQNLE
jgi:uncharacterized protein (TIGR00255 family)